MNFGEALVAVKEGHAVARKGWNGAGQYIYLTSARSLYGYSKKCLQRFSVLRLGRISITLCFTGSAILHWNFSPPALPLNSSIAMHSGNLG